MSKDIGEKRKRKRNIHSKNLWAEGVDGDFTFGEKGEGERNSHWTATPYDDPWVHLREHQKQTLILDLSPILCSLLIQYYLRKSKSYLFCNSQVRVPINTEIPFSCHFFLFPLSSCLVSPLFTSSSGDQVLVLLLLHLWRIPQPPWVVIWKIFSFIRHEVRWIIGIASLLNRFNFTLQPWFSAGFAVLWLSLLCQFLI